MERVIRPDTFYIHDVALTPEFRRSHFGTTVVQLLVNQARLRSLAYPFNL
jgi:hypothetical protein